MNIEREGRTGPPNADDDSTGGTTFGDPVDNPPRGEIESCSTTQETENPGNKDRHGSTSGYGGWLDDDGELDGRLEWWEIEEDRDGERATVSTGAGSINGVLPAMQRRQLDRISSRHHHPTAPQAGADSMCRHAIAAQENNISTVEPKLFDSLEWRRYLEKDPERVFHRRNQQMLVLKANPTWWKASMDREGQAPRTW